MKYFDGADQLEKLGHVPGLYREWGRLTTAVDAEFGNELITALQNASEPAREVIVAAACEGPNPPYTIYVPGNWLSEEAEDYTRFVIGVAEVAARIYPLKKQLDDWEGRKDLLRTLRHCYSTLKETTEPLTEGYTQLSKAVLVCAAANGPWQGFNEHAEYLGHHFDAMEPYLEFIVRSRDTTHSQINMLLTTQPVLPLVKGLL